ncbi:cellular tumor antigen p53-like isoform X2 [Tribolium madens]|uniref:cellular tumor antigen p53-like isoform X2 n=1 Tax=Tribolium madens TaxID=41895 RepID=UPI001CF72E2A|nr:cellular tumor antigen p53-like isoform X2 [Tribolium madens]
MVITQPLEDFKYNIHQNLYLTAPIFPPNEPQELCNTEYPGPLNFEVFVDPNVLKNPWEYSPILNKIYIDMKHKFPINFSVKKTDAERKLFVRVMPMFEEDRYVQELVHRCICHEQLTDPTNHGVSELVAQHIIRCDNQKAQYFGDKNAGKRLSIVIPLGAPQVGTDSVKEFFHFVCKNSCVGGMNRRPIQVIFMLENECGSVLGRRVLCVRICSCPKRDREKEEKKNEPHHSSKKRKIEKKPTPSPETTDTRVFSLSVVGEENYKMLLKVCKSLMSEEIVKLEEKNGNAAPFKKCRNDAINILQQLNE